MMSRKRMQLVIMVILTSIAYLSVKPTRVRAQTDAQRKEIEKLRSELSAAFEKHDEKVANEGVIVQPGWTKEAIKPGIDGKVKVTAKELAEAKALREEINLAVKQDDYVGSVSDVAALNMEHIKNLEKEFAKKSHSQSLLDELSGNNVSSMHETVGAADADEDPDEGPNVVQATALEEHIDVRKLQRLQLHQRRSKEVLILKSIEEDFSFDLGDDVEEWEHTVHGGEEYFIGRRLTDLLVVQQSAAKYKSGTVLSVGQPISYLETYTYWNQESQQLEGVIQVASADRILWYRRSNTTGQLALYWQWTVGYTISGLTHFTSESNDYLAVSSNQSSRAGFYALSIYQYDLEIKEFWIAQRLQMEHPCGEVTIMDTGRDIILAVPQNNSAHIYNFNPRLDGTNHIRFQLLRRFDSEAINSITGFQMGGRSYLALGGHQPQILLYQQGDFMPRTILGSNFGRVDMFFPIPVRTYRDDLLLFVQHRVDFESHGLTVLETLIWDGEAFEASIPVPCQLGGHTAYGASCMLDLHRDEGLKGAALLKRGSEVSLIVPRHKTESGLFRLHTQLLAKNSELLDLQDIFDFMKEWVKEQDDLVAQAQHFLSIPPAELQQAKPDFSKLDLLKVPELQFNGEVGEIRVNDYIWTNADTNTDLDVIMQAIEELEREMEIAPRRSTREVPNPADLNTFFDVLEVESAEIEELVLEKLNSEKSFVQDGQLDFPGTLNMYTLDVLEEVVAENRMSRVATNDTKASMTIEGDLRVDYINGVAWEDLRKDLVLIAEPQELTTLDVEGDVVVEGKLSIQTLNSLDFPEDYLWSRGPRSSVVRATKTFTGTLTAKAVDTEGTINGLNPFDAITLTQPQNWTGLPTFKQLEVSEVLQLNGTTRGRGMEDVPTNPTLQDSTVISAACNLRQLQVLGPLHLYGDYDGQPLGPLLTDIVQWPDEPAEPIKINGEKHFEAVSFPVDFAVEAGTVNDIPLEQFVTLHTEQELFISVLPANVYFRELQLANGSAFDGVVLEELLNNSLKINEPLVSPKTQLNFVGTVKAPLVNARLTLNGAPIREGYQTLNEPLNLSTVHFEHLNTSVANIPNDIEGNRSALLNGVNLHVFLQERDWLIPDDTAKIFLEQLTLTNGAGLQSEQLNGIPASSLLTFLAKIDDLAEMVLDGTVQVDHIHVAGDVQLKHLNGKNFDEDVQMTAIWLNRANYLSTNLTFAEPLMAASDLTILGDYNGRDMLTLIDDIIMRNDNCLMELLAPKTFERDVTVLGDTHMAAINGVPFGYIANKRSNLRFGGTLELSGNLIVPELELSGPLNGYPMSNLSSQLRYDQHLNDFVLLQNRTLLGGKAMPLEDLTVLGDFNGLPNLADFFANLIYKQSKVCRLQGSKTFSGRVTIERGILVQQLNGIDVSQLLQNIVFISDNQGPIQIRTPVIFEEATFAGEVIVRDTLETTNLCGCALSELLNETIRTDQPLNLTKPLTFAPDSLRGNAIDVERLNEVDMSQLITLHTPQNLSRLHFSDVYLDGSITVEGTVNGVKLMSEYENTLLTNSRVPQEVSAPLSLQSVKVLQGLEVRVPVNGDKLLQTVATLQGNNEFESPLHFQEVYAQNVHTNDLISGIDFYEWSSKALSTGSSRAQQRITGNWSVRQLTVNAGVSRPSYILNAETISPLEGYMRTARSESEDGEYAKLCRRAQRLWAEQQQRPYYLQSLQYRFTLALDGDFGPHNQGSLREDVKSMRMFELSNESGNYMLVNTGCLTQVYKWSVVRQHYEKQCAVKTGLIEKVLALSPGDLGFISHVRRSQLSPDKCSNSSLRIWQFNNNCFKHVRDFEGAAEDAQVYGLNSNALYVLTGAKLFKFPAVMGAMNYSESWILSAQGTLRFVPHPKEVMLTNGQQIYWLSDRPNGVKKHNASTKYTLPLHSERTEKTAANSVLIPTRGIERYLSFADFEQMTERILQDLNYRLHLVVNTTQADPEADLYDEHLVQDFKDIMRELQLQSIYPDDVFAAVKLEALEVPENRAQVLAVRTVHIVWPVIVDITEIHHFLQPNETHAHSMCACLMANMGLLARDVLLLANVADVKKPHDYAHQLDAVLERIRDFQKYLVELLDQLQLDINKELTTELVQPVGQETVQTQVSSQLQSLMQPAHLNSTFVLYPLPLNSSYGEMLNLAVGPSLQPNYLLAVSQLDAQLPTQSGVKLYTEPHQAQLYQTLFAHRPRSLATLRIGNDTLLAYVEHCCEVHVLSFRGEQGFVHFAKFKIEETVLQLLALGLPAKEETCRRSFYFAAVLLKRVEFYEVVLAGLPKEDALPCI